jgi:hypothetical protein
MADDDRRHLAIYLNDHLAGSMTGIELVRRAARQYEGTPLGEFFAGLGAEIEQDRDTLKRLMAANGVEQRRYKLAAAWVAEKGARLKFNGALLRRSPLTPFVELETIGLGIRGKEQLWRALRANPADEATAARLDELIARAQSQYEAVEQQRVERGSQALSPARAP